MALLRFLKGNYNSLSSATITEGQVLICGDTGEMFVDVAADKRVKIGDFVVVSNLAALEMLDASAVPTSRLYYVEDGNILARSNGTTWIQINKQQTLSELGGVAKSVYEEKVVSLEKADTDNANAIADVDTRLKTAEDKLKSVATTEGLGDLADTVAEHATAIDIINGTVETEGSMLKIAKDTADLAISNKIGDVEDGKTIVDMIAEVQSSSGYDDEEIRGLINDNAEAIDQEISDREGAISDLQSELEDQISSKVAQSDYDDKVAELVAEDERLSGLVNGNAAAIEELGGEIDTLVGDDAGKSIRTIANQELAAQLIPESAAEALDTLHEIAAWIQEHPDSASAMNAAIGTLQDKVDTGDQTVSAYVTAVIEALNIGDYAKATELAAAIERITALESSSATHATKTEMQSVADDLDAYKQNHNTDYDNDTIDAKVKGVQDQIDALDNTYATDAELTSAINAEVERANGVYADKTIVDSHTSNTDIHVTTADKEKWNSAQENAEKTANDALIAALSWSEF